MSPVSESPAHCVISLHELTEIEQAEDCLFQKVGAVVSALLGVACVYSRPWVALPVGFFSLVCVIDASWGAHIRRKALV